MLYNKTKDLVMGGVICEYLEGKVDTGEENLILILERRATKTDLGRIFKVSRNTMFLEDI